MTASETLSERAQARLADLRFVGQLSQVDANARSLKLIETEHGAAGGKDHIRLTLLVDEAGKVADVRFRSLATGVDLLTYELLAEWCLGRPLDEIATLTPARLQAFAEHFQMDIHPTTVGAGALDQPYYVLVKAAGRQAAEAPAKSKGASLASELPWSHIGLFEKVRRIEAVLDEHVRPALASDGGGLVVADLKEEQAVNILVVEYSGACGSCSSSTGGTMQFIEDTLELNLSVPFRLEIQGQGSDEGYFSPF